MLDDSDLGWAAGMIDGDGCVSVSRAVESRPNRTGVYYAVHLYVLNTTRPILLKLQGLFGGRIVQMHPGLATKETWQWGIHGREAQAVLAVLESYLVAKRAQAQVACIFPVGQAGRRRSACLELGQVIGYLAMRRLNG